MGCIDPDGNVTITAKFMLKQLDRGPLPPEDIARALGEPIFKVRGNLREMKEADFIREEDGIFHITEEGKSKL